MKVLITGGAGFIGGHLTAALMQRGDEVVIADDFSTGSPENLLPCNGVMPEITDEGKPRSVKEIINDAANDAANDPREVGKVGGVRVGSANE